MAEAATRWGAVSALSVFLASGPIAAAAAASRPSTASAPAVVLARALEDLASGDWIIQYRGIRQLGSCGLPQARKPLDDLLAGATGRPAAHPWVRGRALVALSEAYGGQVLDVALRYAGDARPELRAAAVEALGIIGSPRGDGAAAAALRDQAAEVRCQALIAVARLRKAAAWPIVEPFLKDPDPRMLASAARALPSIGTEAARKALHALLEHADAQVRMEAVEGLGRFAHGDDIELLLLRQMRDDSPFLRQKAREVLAAWPPDLLRRRVLEVLKAPDAGLDAAAISVLTLRGDAATCDAIAAGLPTAGTRYKEVLAPLLALLGQTDPDRYRDVLLAHFRHKEPSIRLEALRQIAKCKKLDLFATLRPLLADPHITVRARAISMLAEATKAAPEGGILAYLAGPLHDESWEVRKRAIDLLAVRVTPAELAAGAAALDRVLGDPERHLRDYAAKALARIGDEETQRLLAAAQGYITDWRVIGPFPSDRQNGGLAILYPPQRHTDFRQTCPPWRQDKSAVFEAAQGAAGQGPLLRLAPPAGPRGSKTIATFLLDLPADRSVRLAAEASRGEAADRPGGTAVAVRIGEKPLASLPLAPSGDANSLQASLADYAGGSVELELLAESLADAPAACALLSRPRIEAGGKQVADLAALAATAAWRVEGPAAADKSAQKLQWTAQRTANLSGHLELHDMFPPPTYYQAAYAAADISSDADRPIILEIAVDDAAIVWLNGAEVCRPTATQPAKAKVQLRKGLNRLMVKAANLVDWWQLSVRLTDEAGRRAAGVRASPS